MGASVYVGACMWVRARVRACVCVCVRVCVRVCVCAFVRASLSMYVKQHFSTSTDYKCCEICDRVLFN